MQRVFIYVCFSIIVGFFLTHSIVSKAQQYTVDHLEIKEGWQLDFKNDAILKFYPSTINSLKLHWEMSKFSHPWLKKDHTNISSTTFEDLDTKEFDEYTRRQHKEALDDWKNRKRNHVQNEKNRVERETREYQINLANAQKEFEQETSEWKQEKEEFEKKAKENYEALMKAYKRKRKAHGRAIRKEHRDQRKEYKRIWEEYRKEKKEYEKKKKKGELGFLDRKPTPPDMKKPVDSEESFTEPEPQLAQFTDPAPTLRQVPKPVPAQPFTEPAPLPDNSPPYHPTNLILHLTQNECLPGLYRLKTGRSFHLVATQSGERRGRSPWSRNANLIKCKVEGHALDKGKTYFTMLIDQKRLVSVEFPQLPRLELRRISSPALRTFDQEFQERKMYLNQLNHELYTQKRETQKIEQVTATYTNMTGVQVDVSYTVTGKKKNTIKMNTVLPVFLYDSAEKNKKNMISRVNLFREGKLGHKLYLQMRRMYTHPLRKSKNWLIKADMGYASDEGTVANLIKLQNRMGDKKDNLRIGSDGMVYDFTGLWYLVSWINEKGLKKFSMTYFNDTRVFSMQLEKKINSNSIVFKDEGLNEDRNVTVNTWTLRGIQNQNNWFQFLVGESDHIIYEIRLLTNNTTLKLKEIGTQTIRQNQKWARKFKQRHNIFPIVN